jgi:DNA-binding NarL/FixJ family response regulator
MARLDYEGIVDGWKVELIVDRAKRMGFQEHDIDDAQQVIVLELMNFQYDDDKSNGATEKTAVTAVIDNCLKKLLRCQARYRFHVVAYEDHMEPEYDPNAIQQLGIDVRIACEDLSEEERQVCSSLQAGCSKRAIAANLGCGWQTLNRIMESVRQRFAKMELGEADDE